MVKRLRSGYTTGACAAAAAKAAAFLLKEGHKMHQVEIPFPDGSRHRFALFTTHTDDQGVTVSVIKDAGDDPDVTNGAEICARASWNKPATGPIITGENVMILGGKGVGHATKKGLAAQVGEPAINPTPRRMIKEAVQEVENKRTIYITISIPKGEELAEKTLNKRLGILNGISILGTTGIVHPISAEAWQATIEASINVARQAGLNDIVLSTGRTSERGAEKLLQLPEEAYAMMGDYLAFSLHAAAQGGFTRIHVAGMWAKIIKAALQVPQTHVRNGALEVHDAAQLLIQQGITDPHQHQQLQEANTAREMYGYIQNWERRDIIDGVCLLAKAYMQNLVAQKTSQDIQINVYLINASAEVIHHV